MKKFFAYLFTLIISFIISTIITLILFMISPFKNINVYMYRGLLYIFIVGILLLIVLIILSINKKFVEAKDVLSIFVIFMSIHITFFTLVPVTIDRSQSVFILSQIEMDQDKTMTKNEISDRFLNIYIDEREAFDKRFEEQIVTGSIERISNNTYKLTKRGQFLIDAFRLIGNIYGTNLENMN